MASPTKYGFGGDDGPPEDGGSADEARGAPTVMGHEAHHGPRPGPHQSAAPAGQPTARESAPQREARVRPSLGDVLKVPAGIPVVATASATPVPTPPAALGGAMPVLRGERRPKAAGSRGGRPGPSGKSQFPAMAGFWGRRNTHGNLVPLTDPGLRLLFRRRRIYLEPLLVVLLAATLSFLIALLALKLSGGREPPPPPARAGAAVPHPAALASPRPPLSPPLRPTR